MVHRLSGIALAVFLPLHFWALGQALQGEAALDVFLRWTEQPLVKFAEWGLVLLLGAGLVLVPYVLFVIYTATRRAIPRAAVWTIIVANALWAVASVLLLLSGWVAPNALGVAFVLVQAGVVALLGQLQYVGLRQPLVTA